MSVRNNAHEMMTWFVEAFMFTQATHSFATHGPLVALHRAKILRYPNRG
jgi:hypothetical protein